MELDQLITKAQCGDRESYAAVCEQFRGLVKKEASQRHLAGCREEAECEAWLALAQAVREYDPAKGVPFAGFAQRSVHYRLWNLFKKERRRWQTESALVSQTDQADNENTSVSVLDRLAAVDDLAGEYEQKEMSTALRRALLTLPARQRYVVTETYLCDRKLSDLAAVWGTSVQAVHAMRKKALVSLKASLAGMYLSEGR